jgi:hypothetical protein
MSAVAADLFVDPPIVPDTAGKIMIDIVFIDNYGDRHRLAGVQFKPSNPQQVEKVRAL